MRRGELLRRAVGLVQDLQRLDGERNAVLEAYAATDDPDALRNTGDEPGPCKGPTQVWYGHDRPSHPPPEGSLCECGRFARCRHCGKHHVKILMCDLCGRKNYGPQAASALARRSARQQPPDFGLCAAEHFQPAGPFAGRWVCEQVRDHAGPHAVDSHKGTLTWSR